MMIFFTSVLSYLTLFYRAFQRKNKKIEELEKNIKGIKVKIYFHLFRKYRIKRKQRN